MSRRGERKRRVKGFQRKGGENEGREDLGDKGNDQFKCRGNCSPKKEVTESQGVLSLNTKK